MGLKPLVVYLGKRLGWISLGWLIIYFATQPMAEPGVLMLFGLLVGAVAGLVIGWWLAEEAVERAGFSGMALWVILVVAAWLPPCGIELVMYGLTRLFTGTGWPLGFGRWMVLTATMVVSLAAAVWRAAADD